jgi:hypothetical protein
MLWCCLSPQHPGVVIPGRFWKTFAQLLLQLSFTWWPARWWLWSYWTCVLEWVVQLPGNHTWMYLQGRMTKSCALSLQIHFLEDTRQDMGGTRTTWRVNKSFTVSAFVWSVCAVVQWDWIQQSIHHRFCVADHKDGGTAATTPLCKRWLLHTIENRLVLLYSVTSELLPGYSNIRVQVKSRNYGLHEHPGSDVRTSNCNVRTFEVWY